MTRGFVQSLYLLYPTVIKVITASDRMIPPAYLLYETNRCVWNKKCEKEGSGGQGRVESSETERDERK